MSPNTTPIKIVDNESRLIHRLFKAGIHHPKVMIASVLLVIFCGILSWTFLPVEAFPELGPKNVLIITQNPGIAAQEMEQQVTIPLERGLATIPGLVRTRSNSTFGLSLITLTFDEDTDLYQDRDLTEVQLGDIDLPEGVKPSLGPIIGPSSEILRYVLESNTKDLLALSDIQRWVVAPALRLIPGIASVDTLGGYTKEYQLKLDPHALYKYKVDVKTVLNAIRSGNINAGGGRVSRGEQSYVIRGIGRISSLEDMGNIVVASRNGDPILLSDLGTIEFGHQIRDGLMGWNGTPDAVEGIVLSLRGSSLNFILDNLHKKLHDLNERLAPIGVKITLFLDRSNLVSATIATVGETISTGILLVFILLTFFLGNVVCASIVAISIPIALATTLTLMGVAKIHASMFSLGALDFGIIVDGSIVVCEIILRLRENNPKSLLSKEDAIRCLTKEGKAILTATLTVMVAYAPLFVFHGNEEKLFRPMAYTVLFSLVGALVCALCVIPFLSWYYLKRPRKVVPNILIIKGEALYKKALVWCLPRHKFIYGCIGAAAIGLIGIGSITGQDFMPSLDEGALWMQLELPGGISLEKGSQMSSQVRDLLRSFPEVQYAATQLGRSDEGTDPWTPSHVEIAVGLTPYKTWPWGETRLDLVKQIREKMEKEVPGILFTISQPIEDTIEDQMGGAHAPLVLRIYGDDFVELRKLASQATTILKSIPSSLEVAPLQEVPMPNIIIKPDRFKAARYGISIQDVADLITYGMGDAPITTVIDNERQFNATMMIPSDKLANMDYIGQLPLASSNGTLIPLKEIADITLASGESSIAHEMSERELTLQIDNGSMPLTKYIALANKKLADLHYDPELYHFEWGGNVEQIPEMRKRILIGFALLITLMFVLLFNEFRVLSLPLLIIGVLPLATLGGLVAIYLRGLSLNVSTIAGFIALFGVAVQNCVLMVNAIHTHHLQGMPIHEAMLKGAKDRFRPVVTTAIVATAGMIPASLATGVGTDFQRGVATVVVGGLAPATILTLFLLPLSYCFLEQRLDKHRAHKRSKKGATA